tara:strand:- start:144 stop:1094 length:951 start_codon:yes stop_codon:yes gene_type:complete
MTKIIAELCQNHMGDRKILDEMVAAASQAGANYCKIQSMQSKDLTHRKRFDEGLIEGGKIKVIRRPFRNEIKRLKPLDLNEDDHYYFLELCKKYKIEPLTTIFTRNKLKFLEKLNLNAIKVASFDCASFELLKDLSKSNFKKIFISTGATFDSEILHAKKILNNKDTTFLHCISIYPTTPNVANMNRINFLKSINRKVGFSDHSNPDKYGDLLASIAISMKVDVIERHFTILKKDTTKDGVVSVNFKQLSRLVKLSKTKKIEIDKKLKKIKNLSLIMGKEKRELSNVELLNRDYYQGRFASKIGKRFIFNWEKFNF